MPAADDADRVNNRQGIGKGRHARSLSQFCELLSARSVTSNGFAPDQVRGDPPAGIRALFDISFGCCATLRLCSGAHSRSFPQREADLHRHLIVCDLAIFDMAAGLGDLEP